jgi:hypothetical protein
MNVEHAAVEAQSGVRVPRYLAAAGETIDLDGDGFLLDLGFWGISSPVAGCISLDEAAGLQCLVVLGEPGAGKSVVLETLSGDAFPTDAHLRFRLDLMECSSDAWLIRRLFEAREVAEWRAGSGVLELTLDSLDEGRVNLPNVAALLAGELRRWPTERLRLRVGCRSADWPSVLGDALGEMFPETALLELLPLRRRDVSALADAADVDTAAFFAALSQVNAGHLASRPLSLRLMLRTFARTGELGGNIVELYSGAVAFLCEEQSPARSDNRKVPTSTGAARLAVAGWLAACSVLSGRPTIWTGPSSESDGYALTLADIYDSPGDQAAPGVAITPELVADVLRTGLFKGRGPRRMGWAHRTYAEYLAASYLSERRAGRRQVEALLVADDGAVYPQLRPVAAWLAAIDPGAMGWLAAQDPLLFLTVPIGPPSDQLRAQIVDGLFERAASGGIDQRFGQRGSHLGHSGLAVQVASNLHSPVADVQRLAVDLAKDCRLVDLLDDLIDLFLDAKAPRGVRIAAGSAIAAFKSERATDRLRPRALATPGDDDPDDELKGAALNASWPHAIGLEEALNALTIPQDPNLLGAYSVFIAHHLPAEIVSDDLPTGLRWIQNRSPAENTSGLGRLADEIVSRALKTADIPAIRASLVDLVASRILGQQTLFSDQPHGEVPALGDELRREVLGACLERLGRGDIVGLLIYIRPLRLLDDTDVPWLVACFNAAASPVTQDAVGAAIEFCFRTRHPSAVEAILDLPADHRLRTEFLQYWFESVDLDSKQAAQARERANRLRQPASDISPPSDDEVERWIQNHLDAVCCGDLSRFAPACRLVQVKPGGAHTEDQLDPDLVARPRWATLSTPTRYRFVDAATTYLTVESFERDEWLGTGTLPPEAWSAVVALLLLARVAAPHVLDDLPASAWERWVPALVGYPSGERALNWELKSALLFRTMGRVKRRLVEVAERLLVVAGSEGQAPFVEQELRVLWCVELQERVVAGLDNGALVGGAWDHAAGLLAEQNPAAAIPILLRVLSDQASPPGRRRLAGTLLLRHGTTATWSPTFDVILHEPELGVAMVEGHARDAVFNPAVPPIGVIDLAALYLWLVDRYPYDSDPPRSGAVEVTDRQRVAEWRDDILRTIVDNGTDAAVETLRSIERVLPNETWLGRLRREAEEKRRQREWIPVDPKALLRLLGAANRRLINSERHLCAVVVEALASIQQQLISHNPASHDLWDSHARRPKSEDEISDWLARHLGHELRDTVTVVDREVQVRRTGRGIGERTDILVQVARQEATTQPIRLALEVKGIWNPGVVDDLELQLVNRYMTDLATSYGIYLVLWPDQESWTREDTRRQRAANQSRTIRPLLEAARRKAETTGRHVVVQHLDISYRRPAPDAEADSDHR